MKRVTLSLSRPLRLRYRDSLHAALVSGLRQAGAEESLILGPKAAPWTFGVSGRSFPGGVTKVSSLTVSSGHPVLDSALERVDPATVRWRSSNGDVVDCTGASLRTDTFPLAPNQEEITVAFASPFLIALRGEKNKAYARGLEGLDLSAAFSAGLSRRFERQILIEVRPDPLSARIDGSKPVLVRVRKSAGRDLILPALSVDLTLRGSNADLCCAYFGGLGEKTRYGFGCVVALD